MKRRSRVSRRSFLKRSGSALATIAIIPQYILGKAGHVPPSDKINIAVIGTGGQGIVNMKSLLKQSDVQIVAIADPNEESDYSAFYYRGTAGRKPALELLEEPTVAGSSSKCKPYLDFRVMLEKESNIDSVLIATPDHVHAVAAMAAIQLGKHIYCEKPLTHTIYEARKIVAAAKEAGIATQMGNQGHSGEGIRQTCEWIWDGAIGSVSEVHAWTGGGDWSLDGRPKETPPIPQTLDWDLWLGPAPFRPYHPIYAPFNWRRWWDFGTASLGDMACHNIDPAFWALKLGHPKSVEAIDTHSGPEVVPTSSTVRYDFPARGEMPPVTLTWYDGKRRPAVPDELKNEPLGRNGILFVGEKGKILCGGWGGPPRLLPEQLAKSYSMPSKTIPRSEGHHRDWLNACKGGSAASASFDYSGLLTEVVLLGNVAQRSSGKLEWDGQYMTVTNNSEANQFIQTCYRAGWEL